MDGVAGNSAFLCNTGKKGEEGASGADQDGGLWDCIPLWPGMLLLY